METTIIQWHKQTFPQANIESQLLKLDEELNEYHNAIFKDRNEAKKELVDVWIVAIVLQERFKSHIGRFVLNQVMKGEYPYFFDSIEEFYEAIQEKMEANKSRVWVFENGVYHHV